MRHGPTIIASSMCNEEKVGSFSGKVLSDMMISNEVEADGIKKTNEFGDYKII